MRALPVLCLVGAVGVASAVATAACDDSSAVKEPISKNDAGSWSRDGGPAVTDGGPLGDGAVSDCYLDPKTHEEIINACTDAVKIPKTPTLPLLLPDGGVPPLP